MQKVALGIVYHAGKILSVSRKTNQTDLGFPGGKVDPGETEYFALQREAWEETGIDIQMASILDRSVRKFGDGPEIEITMYIVDHWSGSARSKEEGKVEWVHFGAVFTNNCSFKEYNLEMLQKFALVKQLPIVFDTDEDHWDHPVMQASKAKDVETFMKLLCPQEWHPIVARIVETGVKFDPGLCKWLIGWSDIPNTVKFGENSLETALKTCMFKMHDCFHQLWGIPIPSREFTEDEFYVSKRAQMCGEVSVLTMTEFMFAQHLWDTYPELRQYLEKRNSLKMMHGVLKGKTAVEIAMRLDDVLHKKRRPRWMRNDPASMAFADDYVPMLQQDRDNIDHNWNVMKQAMWIPENAPNIRYSPNVDGLELTIWMITDFYHMLKTDDKIDYALAEFNHQRRQSIVIPEGWRH